MISNRHGLEIFFNAFKEAAEGEEFLDMSKFHYAVILLSKAIYGKNSDENENPFEEMFTNMLLDKNISANNSLVGGRIPRLDEDTKEVLSEEGIIVYLAYVNQLKKLFTRYNEFNLTNPEENVQWREVAEKSMGIKCSAFLKFCRDNLMIPHMFNVESLHEILRFTIPPITQEEYQYFD